MIADMRTIPTGSTLECDICIIGAGAAGITIAREFISSAHRVFLLESGGMRREAKVQRLYEGQSVGERHYPEMHDSRSRFFGGSTNCWAGICTPLNEIDFERRPWVPGSGWPISSAEIVAYLRRAHQICGRGPFIYDERAWKLIGVPVGFNPDWFEPFVWHYNNRSRGDVRFGRRFRSELSRASNIHVLLHANVVELLTEPSGRLVERVRLRTLDGRAHSLRAKMFVLACGGIENPRLLLASDSQHPSGLGNQRDLVGRYFQEHFEAPCATLVPSSGVSRASCYASLSKLGGSYCLPGLSLAAKAQTAFQTLNGSISVEPFYPEDGALMAFQSLRSDLHARKITGRTLGHLWRVAGRGPTLIPEVWRRVAYGDRPRGDPHRFVIFGRTEQAPNPESRILLSNDVDELRMRKVSLDWRTTALDRKTFRILAQFAAEEFARLGLGQVVPDPWLFGEAWPDSLVSGPHHIGTTRMSDDESTGVVDRNCRVHGLNGLYIAGSSVFPTGGHANPTLTIIALALRLADHLRHALASKPAAVLEREPSGAAS